MSFDLGPISPALRTEGAPSVRAAAPAGAPDFQAVLAGASAPAREDVVDVSVPGSPPADAHDAVGAAADRAEQLAQQGRELHFETDKQTGRVIVQVRELATGKVIRTIPPRDALAMLTGGE
jgi:DNA-directed RNA polymerase subunit K/omega